MSLGHVESGPTLDTSVLNLKYTGGQACPHSNGTRTSIIRFKCDKVVSEAPLIFKTSSGLISEWRSLVFLLTQYSRPILISVIEDCVYTFLWLTPVACPLNSTQQDECRVTNSATGPTFSTRFRWA